MRDHPVYERRGGGVLRAPVSFERDEDRYCLGQG